MSIATLLLACLGLVNAAFRQPTISACEAQVDKELKWMARHYCRSQIHEPEGSSQSIGGTSDGANQMDALYEEVSPHVMPLIKCAFGNYDYRSGELQKPAELTPSEALRMMKACTAQCAMQVYLLTRLEASETYDEESCVGEAYRSLVANPIGESRPILKNLDMEAMTAPNPKSICLKMVMSGFAREYVSNVALPGPPPEPGTIDWLRGHRLKMQVYDMNLMLKDVQWINLWILLKRWDIPGAKLKGWTLDKQLGSPFPLCTVYYETQ